NRRTPTKGKSIATPSHFPPEGKQCPQRAGTGTAYPSEPPNFAQTTVFGLARRATSAHALRCSFQRFKKALFRTLGGPTRTRAPTKTPKRSCWSCFLTLSHSGPQNQKN